MDRWQPGRRVASKGPRITDASRDVEAMEPPSEPGQPVDNSGLWASIDRISASVPDHVWARVPEDASQRIDDYLAGE